MSGRHRVVRVQGLPREAPGGPRKLLQDYIDREMRSTENTQVDSHPKSEFNDDAESSKRSNAMEELDEAATSSVIQDPDDASVVHSVQGSNVVKESNTISELSEGHESDRYAQTKVTRSYEFSIVPACEDGERSLVALVEFRNGIPEFLKDLDTEKTSSQTHVVTVDGYDISFDIHFQGFTQLYPCQNPADVTVDIVAICGIGGHPYGSWQSKDGPRRMWLKDFLSADLPRARTMIYGYNTKLGNRATSLIDDYARELLEYLKTIRGANENIRRPLIFICHSFGGIILAKALINAQKEYDADDPDPIIYNLRKAVYGIFFCAVPQRGIDVEDMRSLFDDKKHPRLSLLNQIHSDSKELATQLQEFKRVIKKKKIVSLYETLEERRLKKVGQEWSRTGKYYKTTLDMDSYTLQLSNKKEIKIPVNGTHSEIVKFPTNTTKAYKAVLKHLRDFERDAPGFVESRFPYDRELRHGTTIPVNNEDESFVDREFIIEKIDDVLSTEGLSRWAVLYGERGTGKSRLATEYGMRLKRKSKDTHMLYMNVENRECAKRSFNQVAEKLGLEIGDDAQESVPSLVRQWLAGNKSWFLILDNVSESILRTPLEQTQRRGSISHDQIHPGSLLSFIPQRQRGRVLMTLCDEGMDRGVLPDHIKQIEVPAMTREQALAMFKERIPIAPTDEEDALKRLEEMDYNPQRIDEYAEQLMEHSRSSDFTERLIKLSKRNTQLSTRSQVSRTFRFATEKSRHLRELMRRKKPDQRVKSWKPEMEATSVPAPREPRESQDVTN